MTENKQFVDLGVKEKARKKAVSRVSSISLLCLIFLAVPNFNTIDFLPDFVAYIILAWWFGKYSDMVPYFHEAKDAFWKLAAVSIAKVPAMFIMLANMSSGRDIVALFTLVFITLELILLIPAIRASFSALAYVGQRGDAPATILPIRILGKPISQEDIEKLSIVFVCFKAVLNLIPDFFLMTNENSDAELSMRMLFPIVTIVCMSLVLAVGIFWILIMRKYAVSIASEGKLHAAALSIAGSARLEEIEKRKGVKRMLFTLTALIPVALLNFDFAFESLNNGANIIPHFLLGIAAIIVALLLFDNERDKRIVLILGVVFTSVSLYTNHLVNSWHALYDYTEIGYITFATDAYLRVEIFSVIEFILAAVLAVFFIKAFLRFVYDNTPVSHSASRIDNDSRRTLTIKSLIYLVSPLFLLALKTLGVFIAADVRYELVDSPEAAVGAIVTSSAPWFSTAITILTLIYVIYSYYYLNELKSEIKMKNSDETTDF